MNFFQALESYLKSLSPFELYTPVIYLVLFLLSIGLVKFITDKLLKENKIEKALLYGIDALLFAIAGIAVYQKISDPLWKLLFKDISLSLTAFAFALSVFSVSPVGKLLKSLTFFGLLFAVISEIVIFFTTNVLLANVLFYIRKALILFAVYPIFYGLVDLISPQKFKKPLKWILTAVFAVIGVLWELQIIHFANKAFIGIGIATLISLFFVWYLTQGVVYLKLLLQKFKFEGEDLEHIVNSTTKLLTVLYLIAIWETLIYFFNFQYLEQKLNEITIVDTDFVRISLYNLISSYLLFLTLYYSINILKKLVKLFFKPTEREEKGGALEAVIYNIGVLIALIAALVKLGLTWKVILPVAGALGVGLGFGLQMILNNYVSGFIMMFSRNIKVGDFIEIPGNAGRFINNDSNTIFGRVENISILSTRVRTLDGIDILVPNSTFVGNQIINYSFGNPYVRVRFPFGVAYSSDPKKVKEILLDLAYKCPWAKNYYKPPQVWFYKLGDSALLFYLLIWIDIREIWRNPHATLSQSLFDWVYTNGFLKLKEAGIEIPFPQNDIWFRNNLKVVFEKEDGTILGTLGNNPPQVEQNEEKPKKENPQRSEQNKENSKVDKINSQSEKNQNT
jgi:potassium efflux system protein